jgi:hypothetical protein
VLEYRLCVKSPMTPATLCTARCPRRTCTSGNTRRSTPSSKPSAMSGPAPHARARALKRTHTARTLTGALQTGSCARSRPALHLLVRCSWVWGRGAVDNKHNLLMQLYTIERRLRAGMGRSCGNGRTHATSAPGLGLGPATSAPGLASSPPTSAPGPCTYARLPWVRCGNSEPSPGADVAG